MKKLKKSVLFVLALIIALSTCVLFPVTANAASWKTAYLDYVEELMNKANSEGLKCARFGLIDFDEDGVPELIYDSGFHLRGGSLSCYHNEIITMNMGRGTYLRNKNLLFVSYVFQGTKKDLVIRIIQNSPMYVFHGTQIAKGTNFSSTNPNDFSYKYRLENQNVDTDVSYSQYNNQLNAVFNFNTAIDLKSSITLTFSGVKTAITNYCDSSSGLYARGIGDTNLDGNIDINDVTAIQRHLADISSFNDEQLALADTNGDGAVTIDDATHLQLFLAEFFFYKHSS